MALSTQCRHARLSVPFQLRGGGFVVFAYALLRRASFGALLGAKSRR
jgi:hypothetical protein